jgi:hypothetical protein
VNEACDTIRPILTTVPGTGESIAGLKVVTDDERLAVGPSGSEDVLQAGRVKGSATASIWTHPQEGASACHQNVRAGIRFAAGCPEQRELPALMTLDLLGRGSTFHVQTTSLKSHAT